jgi:hypothetical protein
VRKTVDVVNYPDGRFAVEFEGISLSFRKFDKIQTVEPGEIVENKRLGAALAMVKQHQDTYEPHRRRYHPARQRGRRTTSKHRASRQRDGLRARSRLRWRRGGWRRG